MSTCPTASVPASTAAARASSRAPARPARRTSRGSRAKLRSWRRCSTATATSYNCILVGLGVSAISHVDDSYSQNFRELPSWERALDEDRLPLWRGIELDADEREYEIEFRRYFADALSQLEILAEDGLVTVEATRIAATPRGRFLLRAVAMCFDRYLARTETHGYSRVV